MTIRELIDSLGTMYPVVGREWAQRVSDAADIGGFVRQTETPSVKNVLWIDPSETPPFIP